MIRSGPGTVRRRSTKEVSDKVCVDGRIIKIDTVRVRGSESYTGNGCLFGKEESDREVTERVKLLSWRQGTKDEE